MPLPNYLLIDILTVYVRLFWLSQRKLCPLDNDLHRYWSLYWPLFHQRINEALQKTIIRCLCVGHSYPNLKYSRHIKWNK